MQTLVQIACTKGKSLRDSIANDTQLQNYHFKILREKNLVVSLVGQKFEAVILVVVEPLINIQWSASTKFLTCRVINKGAGRPNLIVGDFIGYLLERHERRVQLVTIWTER